MRVLQVFGLLMLIVMASYGGKVTWDSNGKPQVKHSGKAVQGCSQGGFDALFTENNSSRGCSTKKS